MTDNAVCDTGLQLSRKSSYDPQNGIISEGMVFSTLSELKLFLQDYACITIGLTLLHILIKT
jgi:hypothetical protein